MSNIPTWKNVSAPDYSSSNWLMDRAHDRQSGAFEKGTELLNAAGGRRRDKLTGEAMGQIAQMNNLDSFNQDKAAFLQSLNMGGVHQDQLMEALGGRQDELYSQDSMDFDRKHRDQLMGLKIAGLQRAASGGGGGGRGGSGGSSLEGMHGASKEDMLLNAMLPEMEGKTFNEKEEIYKTKGAEFGMSSKELGYSFKNRFGGAQTRSNKKKDTDAGYKKGSASVTDKFLKNTESPWYNWLDRDPGVQEGNLAWANDMRMHGAKEDVIADIATKTTGSNRVMDISERDKLSDIARQELKALKGTQ